MRGDGRHQRAADGAVVALEPGMSLDRVLQLFKRQCERAAIFRELKLRESFTSPSEARRMKSRRARQRARKAAERRGETA